MIQGMNVPMGKACSPDKAPGHWVLARLGKRVLRPGGLELTRCMLETLDIGEQDAVVEFAPGLGATARLTLARNPGSYTAIERDQKAADSVRRLLDGDSRRCLVGRAESTGLPDGCATVVYGEAMLTMQSLTAKSRIVEEAVRLLKAGGRYGIHEMAITPESITPDLAETIRSELTDAIHHDVRPLTVAGWRSLLESQGLSALSVHTAPMHLLEPRRLLADEGAIGALRFGWNLLRDRESRSRVLKMRRVFRRYASHLAAVMIVAGK